MHLDVTELRSFYDSPLGRMAARQIGRAVREIWPDVKGLRVAALGYGLPYLAEFRGEAERVVALMPAAQGVVRWPPDGRNVVALAEDADLPLPDESFDRILLVHLIENSEHVRPCLREIWRVLASGGRLIVIAPNRRGLWAESERTPFGHGAPFSKRQLADLLAGSLFAPLSWRAALFAPPGRGRMMRGAFDTLDSIGRRWWSHLGGVHLVEAEKRIYAANVARVRRPFLAPRPAPTRI